MHLHRHPDHTSATEKQGVERPAHRCQDTNRDQRVHRCRAMLCVHPCRAVKGPRRPRRHRKRQGGHHPLPAGKLQGRHHTEHHDGNREEGREDDPTSKFSNPVWSGSRGFARRASPVPRFFHLGDQFFQIRGFCPDGGLFGRVIHRGGHTRKVIQAFFHPSRARRAGHPLDIELDRVARIRSDETHDCSATASRR